MDATRRLGEADIDALTDGGDSHLLGRQSRLARFWALQLTCINGEDPEKEAELQSISPELGEVRNGGDSQRPSG
jgi:hypothetical protein